MSELRLTLRWVANAVGGRILTGGPDRVIGQIVTDTRTLHAGDFFVALRGPRFDGHAFVTSALTQGAMGALVDREWVEAEGQGGAGALAWADIKVRPYGNSRGEVDVVGADLQVRAPGQSGDDHRGGAGVIEVADTTTALQDLAHAVRAATSTRVVAITGSAGKTTTKDIIAEFLGGGFRVVKNKGNMNNHIGLPLSLMQLRTGPDVAVMELGMNHAGEISRLVAIADPDVRVWTNVGDAHLGFFASPGAIADAKAEILEGAGRDDLLVCNADDAQVMARIAAFPGRTVTFGTSDRATVSAHDIKDLGIDGMRAAVTTPAGEAGLETPLLGRGNLANVLAGMAVALEFGVPLSSIVASAATLKPADRRGAVHRLRGGVTVIDDSYNSSPTALRRALDVVAGETRTARKVAVVGEMLELGEYAMSLHEECGRAAAAAGLRLLFVIGGQPARVLANAAIAAGMPAASVTHFEQSTQAAAIVASAVRAGDLILVKGSRGTRTDVVADRIVAEFA